ncbi:MAG: YceD family protein [Pseudomonadales bacterium]
MLTGQLPDKIDHRKFAGAEVDLSGTIPLSRCTRLIKSLESDQGDLEAQAKFRFGKKKRTHVSGKATVDISLVCQACMEPMVVTLSVAVSLNITDSEEALLALSPSEDGLIVASKLLNLVDLFEDELILNLPMIARHQDGNCGGTHNVADEAISSKSEDDNAIEEDVDSGRISGETYRPFAGLSGLRETVEYKAADINDKE